MGVPSQAHGASDHGGGRGVRHQRHDGRVLRRCRRIADVECRDHRCGKGRRRERPGADEAHEDRSPDRSCEDRKLAPELGPQRATVEVHPRSRRRDVIVAEGLALLLRHLAEVGDAHAGQRMCGVELDEPRPWIVVVEQHRLCRLAGACAVALGDEPDVAGILHVDDAHVPRALQQALRGLGVLDLDDAVGDLDQRAREVAPFDALGGEGVSEIFARAAEIVEQEDADVVHGERGEPDDDDAAVLLVAARARAAHRRGVDLVEDLHEGAGSGHDDEIAVDDVAELVRDNRSCFVLVQELEDAFGQHDARIGAQQPVGERGRVAVGDDADARCGEAVLVGNGVRHLVHGRVLGLHGRVVEPGELVEPAQREVRDPRAHEPDHGINDDRQRDREREIDLIGRHHGGERHADDHAEQQTNGHERGEEQPGHDIPLKLCCGAGEASAN